MLANVQELTFPTRGDERGRLIIQEGASDLVPFEIKRTFFIFDTTPGTIRGNHAHYKNRQVLICVSGACTIKCEMPDGIKRTYRLDWPNKGLLIEGMVWHTMEDAVERGRWRSSLKMRYYLFLQVSTMMKVIT